jgi:hypothetical protein
MLVHSIAQVCLSVMFTKKMSPIITERDLHSFDLSQSTMGRFLMVDKERWFLCWGVLHIKHDYSL